MDVPGFALITGGASGIGMACAQAFLNEGSAGIALVDLNDEALQLAKDELEKKKSEASNAKPCQILTFTLDVSDEKQVDDVVGQVAQAFGRLDYVINAAGVAGKTQGGVTGIETAAWDQTLSVNLTGTMLIIRAAARIMSAQEPILSSRNNRPLQRGSIVNIASILGLVGMQNTAAYTATKHAVIGVTKCVAEEYADLGVRINAMCPGFTDTPMIGSDAERKAIINYIVDARVPMKRLGRPDEIADGVLYLAGGRSSFVTGTSLVVDGGYTAI